MSLKHLLVVGLGALSASAAAQDHSNHGTHTPARADTPYQMQGSGAGHHDPMFLFLQADRLETQFHDGEETLVWDTNAWYGGDLNKLWIKSEGELSLSGSEFEEAEVQALWSHAISTYFDLQTGLRYDIAGKDRVHAAFGVMGLAPYWFEVDAMAYVSDKGDITATVELEYELLLTQRLILQPRAELGFSAQHVPDAGLGKGLTGLDTGIRLRYEIIREFAPYVGIEWQKRFGATADMMRRDGEDPNRIVLVAGIRAWF